MPMTQEDRIAFSLKIVGADAEAKGLDSAKATLQGEIAKVQKLDTANKNLFDPVNALINGYQSELEKLNGIQRTTITEQMILDSGAKKIQNAFFPNDTSVTVPSLSAFKNVWPQVKPFALTFAIGKNYTEGFAGTVTKESDLIQNCLTLISSASANTDIENTSGQTCGASGTCSIPIHTTQTACTTNGGIWTPGPDQIITFTAVHTLKTNLVNAVNALFSFLTTEGSSVVTNDPDSAKQAENNAALSNINTIIKPLLTAWLAYPDFQTVPPAITTCSAFFAYNPSLLAPTKLHSTELTALQNALNTRLTFLTTRTSQITTNLGGITQDLNTGDLTSSTGLYGKRYGFLLLRLNAFGGSLTQLIGLQTATGAQDGIKANVLDTKATYNAILPTTPLKANANGSAIIHVIDPTLYSVGDTVYVYAENQEELKRAIKAISGNMVTLNDVVPGKYRTSEKARMYKDLT
jgi:hypothetical protein